MLRVLTLAGMLIALVVGADEARAQAAIFVGTGVFDGGQPSRQTVKRLAESGFDTALLEVHFAEDGSIRSNKATLIQGGAWVAGAGPKKVVTDLVAALPRVEIWFAGWSRRDYDQIRKVRASKDATAELERNLAAVKRLGVCGITDDDEDVYDTPLAVWMGGRIRHAGLRYSISPYKHPEHWRTLAECVGVDRIYYQSYSPRRRLEGWDELDGELWPGVNTDRDDADQTAEKFAEWGRNPKVVGGFVWSDHVIRTKRNSEYKSFAEAIKQSVNPGAKTGCAEQHDEPAPVSGG